MQIDTVAAIKDAKPKLTESEIVQFPISQNQPVTYDSALREENSPASW